MAESIDLFVGRAGEDNVRVWLDPEGSGVTVRTHEWGAGIERNFGFDTIETSLEIGASALSALASAIRAEISGVEAHATPLDIVAAAYRGDSAASGRIRTRLDELGLRYEFQMR
jgi:hypothetical protein